MRPPWPRLALRSLVRGGPVGPGCGLGWPRQECPGVAKLLIQLHLVAFRCFSYRLRGAGMRRSRESRNDEDQCSSQRRYGVMGSCRWFGGWAYVGDGMAFGRFANRPYIDTGTGCEVRASRERRGGVNPGPIWPCLASFTPNDEAGNEATVASFGTALTRTRWASWPWLWPWLASSGVPRSDETFNSVAFGCISLLFLSSEPSP